MLEGHPVPVIGDTAHLIALANAEPPEPMTETVCEFELTITAITATPMIARITPVIAPASSFMGIL